MVRTMLLQPAAQLFDRGKRCNLPSQRRNLLFFLINAAYAVQIAYARRPIKFRVRGPPTHRLSTAFLTTLVLQTVHEEELYRNLFAKVGVSRIMFQSLLSHALVRRLKAGTTYVDVTGWRSCFHPTHWLVASLCRSYIEAGNEAANLSIVISGVVSVISKPAVRLCIARWKMLCDHIAAKRGAVLLRACCFSGQDGSMAKLLSTITKHEFIESPQWAARSLCVPAHLCVCVCGFWCVLVCVGVCLCVCMWERVSV